MKSFRVKWTMKVMSYLIVGPPSLGKCIHSIQSQMNTFLCYSNVTKSSIWEFYGYVYQFIVRIIPTLIISIVNIIMLIQMKVSTSTSENTLKYNFLKPEYISENHG